MSLYLFPCAVRSLAPSGRSSGLCPGFWELTSKPLGTPLEQQEYLGAQGRPYLVCAVVVTWGGGREPPTGEKGLDTDLSHLCLLMKSQEPWHWCFSGILDCRALECAHTWVMGG